MRKKLIIDIEAQADRAKPSITKQLATHLPDIELYLEQGVPRQIILEHLNDIGFDLSMSTFATMLKRLRKKMKSGKLNPSSLGQPKHRPTATDKGGVDLYRDGPKKLKHDLTKTSDW